MIIKYTKELCKVNFQQIPVLNERFYKGIKNFKSRIFYTFLIQNLGYLFSFSIKEINYLFIL